MQANFLKLVLGLTTGLVLISCSQQEPQNQTPSADQSASSTEQEKSLEAFVPEVKTYARFVPERKDDFAFENDLVAFRKYGPAARSGSENAGTDCWLKRVDYSIIDKWYKQHLELDKSYHQDWGEGLDNYHVGSSAGCGSSALWIDGKREPLEAFVSWEMLSQSTEKTEFALNYEREVAGDVYTERKVISIELGSRLFKAVSTFKKNGELALGLPVVVGVTTHDEAASVESDVAKGYLAAWENLDGAGLGTGILLAADRIEQSLIVESEGEKDKGHALFLTSTDSNGQVSYYAGYGWEKAGDIKTMQEWTAYLAEYKD